MVSFMESAIVERLCRAVGVKDESAAGRRLIAGVQSMMGLREQAGDPDGERRDAARDAFRDAVDRLRAATVSAGTWVGMGGTGTDEEMQTILSRLETIVSTLGEEFEPRRARSGSAVRGPRAAQMGFARLVALDCHRCATIEGLSTLSAPDVPRFMWLVHAVLTAAPLPEEGSAIETNLIRAFAAGASGPQPPPPEIG